MNKNRIYKTIYREAYAFLLRNKAINEEIIRNQIDYYLHCKPSDLNSLFIKMVQSLKNKQGYKNFIADTDEMERLLMDFDPKKVVAKYQGNWKPLFRSMKRKFGKKYVNMDISNNRNAWVIFSKGVISCANFLNGFDTIGDFDKFVNRFTHDEYTSVALPMLLEKEIFGYGFPLACDFLKESGYVQFGKPDVHIKDIFRRLLLVDDDSDYEVFKVIIKMAKAISVEPVIVDKILWLIGSGDFYDSGIKIGRQKGNFTNYMQEKYPKEFGEFAFWPILRRYTGKPCVYGPENYLIFRHYLNSDLSLKNYFKDIEKAIQISG